MAIVVFWTLLVVSFLSALVALSRDNKTALAVSVAAMAVAILVVLVEFVMAWRKG